MAEIPITSLTTSDKVKKGVNPLFSCENERFVSFSAKRGRKKVVTKVKKYRHHDLHCPSSRGSGAILAEQSPTKFIETSNRQISRKSRLGPGSLPLPIV